MYTQTTHQNNGRSRMSLGIEQARSLKRATSEASEYQIAWALFGVRMHGSATRELVPVAYVTRKGEDGRGYSVTFLPGSKPLCTCPHAHRHAQDPGYRCKHVLMAEKTKKPQAPKSAPKPGSPEARSIIGNPELDMKVVKEQDGLFYVHRIMGDGRYGFERWQSVLNPGCRTEEDAQAVLSHLKKIRAEAEKRPLSDLR